MPESTNRGALTEAVYYILLSVFNPLHGYGIMQLVSELSNNRLSLGPGTLYGAINTLLKKEWIELVDTANNVRKKEYIITDLGKEIIKQEITRLKELIGNGTKISGGDKNDL
jgi:DNA-binding PadR family transcriptional regulator